MKIKLRIFLALVVVIVSSQPALAETDTARIGKLEERMRDIEARVAKTEASANKQMEMMDHDKHQGMGMTNPMGQTPQQGMGGMPQGGSQQPPTSSMPAGGGMGHM